MQEIVDEVLKAEEEAEAVVKDARQKAMEMKTNAENRVSDKMKKAKEDAQISIQNAVKTAKDQARAAHEKAIKEAEEANNEFYKKNEKKIRLVIDEVARLILIPEYDRDYPEYDRE
ncbi:MAG: hypothetical protein JW881_02605 [Spirochaetales bacterium]|nr:hypothetical protein [Spirochaetales bacterium]